MSFVLNEEFLRGLISEAEQSPRKRSHYNLHKKTDESVQRLCIALKKGTYIRPHHHPESNKWELTIALKGKVAILVFDRSGIVIERMEISPDSSCAVEIQPNTWHTTFPLGDEAIIMEVKEGPFVPIHTSSFAQWAPEEGDKAVLEFLEWAELAKTGDSYR